MMNKVKARERLLDLPDVFDLRDVSLLTGWSSNAVYVNCHRWVKQGLISPVGPRAATYYNLVVDPKGPEKLIGKALKLMMPSAVVVGGSSVAWAGWTTQMPRILEVVVPKTEQNKAFPVVNGARIAMRGKVWYKRMGLGGAIEKDGPFGLHVLKPDAAIVDAANYRDVMKEMDVDDINFPSDYDAQKLLQWCEMLKCNSNCWNKIEKIIESSEVSEQEEAGEEWVFE